jgi:hypothetical protein
LFDLPLVISDGGTIKDMEFVPSAVDGEGLLVWREVFPDGPPLIRWLRLANGVDMEGQATFAVPDTEFTGQFAYNDPGAISPLAVVADPQGHTVVYQDIIQGQPQLFALLLRQGTTPQPIALTQDPGQHLFPALAFVGDGYQLTWVTRVSQTQRKFMTLHMDLAAQPIGSPTELLDALGLKFRPNALHFMPPYGVLSLVASSTYNSEPQTVKWSLLNRQGDALCLP